MDTDYPIQKVHGQLVYGPHPKYSHIVPPKGSEVFVAKLPRNVFEDVLAPLFSRAGEIFEMRIMIDFSGSTRGFAFVAYLDVSAADGAIETLNGFEIRPNHQIFVCKSLDNCRISLTGIPRELSAEKIFQIMKNNSDTVKEVIAFLEPGCQSRNRGMIIVEYESHRAACVARRDLITHPDVPFKSKIKVDWASADRSKDPEGPKQHWSSVPPICKYFETIKNVDAVLFIDKLPEVVNTKFLKDFLISKKLEIKDVAKVDGHAFVHFRSKVHAERALKKMKGWMLAGKEIQVIRARNVQLSFSSEESSEESSSVSPERPLRDVNMPLSVQCEKSHENQGNLLPSPTAQSYPAFTSFLTPEQTLVYTCLKNKWELPIVRFLYVAPRQYDITENMPWMRCKVQLFSHTVIEYGSSMTDAVNKASERMLQILEASKNGAAATGPCEYSASNYISTRQSDSPTFGHSLCSTYAEVTAVGTKMKKREHKNAYSIHDHSEAEVDILRNHRYHDKWPPFCDRPPRSCSKAEVDILRNHGYHDKWPPFCDRPPCSYPKGASSKQRSWSPLFDYDKSCFSFHPGAMDDEHLDNTAAGNQFGDPTNGKHCVLKNKTRNKTKFSLFSDDYVNHSHDDFALNGHSLNHYALTSSSESGFGPSSSNVAIARPSLCSSLSDVELQLLEESLNTSNARAEMGPAIFDEDHIPLYRRHDVNYHHGDSTSNGNFPLHSTFASSLNGSFASNSDAARLISNSHVRSGMDSAVFDDTYIPYPSSHDAENGSGSTPYSLGFNFPTAKEF